MKTSAFIIMVPVIILLLSAVSFPSIESLDSPAPEIKHISNEPPKNIPLKVTAKTTTEKLTLLNPFLSKPPLYATAPAFLPPHNSSVPVLRGIVSSGDVRLALVEYKNNSDFYQENQKIYDYTLYNIETASILLGNERKKIRLYLNKECQ